VQLLTVSIRLTGRKKTIKKKDYEEDCLFVSIAELIAVHIVYVGKRAHQL
jgi:hypothetical protein